MLLVGLTGGIGSGKSTVAGQLKDSGAVIVDGDRIAREIVEPGQPALRELVKEFGSKILMSEGTLNRAALARLAFASPEATATLNGIMHPRIHALTEQRFREAPEDSIVVFDMPLLVENGLAPMCGLVIVITAETEVRVERLVQYRGLEADDARRRMKAQLSDEERAEYADVVLDNTGPRERLIPVVERLWKQRLIPWSEWMNSGSNPNLGFDDPTLATPERCRTGYRGVRRVRPDHRAERLTARLSRALETQPEEIHLAGDVNGETNGHITVTVPSSAVPALEHSTAGLPLDAPAHEALGWLGYTEDPGGKQWVSGDPFNPVLVRFT